MDISYSFRWALVYRFVAVLSLLLGLALVAVGFLAGFQGAITTLIADPLDPGPAIEQANPTITVAFCVLALVVWQFGKTYALFLTLPRAAGRAAARKFDANRVSSAVTADLDERLAAIEDDVAETRRAVAALEGDGYAATYDEDETEAHEEQAHSASTAEPATSAGGTGDDSSGRSASGSESDRDRSSGSAGSIGTSTSSGSAADGAIDATGTGDTTGGDPLADDASDDTFDRD